MTGVSLRTMRKVGQWTTAEGYAFGTRNRGLWIGEIRLGIMSMVCSEHGHLCARRGLPRRVSPAIVLLLGSAGETRHQLCVSTTVGHCASLPRSPESRRCARALLYIKDSGSAPAGTATTQCGVLLCFPPLLWRALRGPRFFIACRWPGGSAPTGFEYDRSDVALPGGCMPTHPLTKHTEFVARVPRCH